MNKLSIKTVVAIGIGAAIFFVVGRFVAIPTGIPNTNVTIQYGILGVFSAIFGPIAGFLIGLIGHALIDMSFGYGIWWSWVIASAVVGLVCGIGGNLLKINEGSFNSKKIGGYLVFGIVANLIAWLLVAPLLDVAIYAEAIEKVYAQAFVATIVNVIATSVIGVILLGAFAKTRVSKGSLKVD